ncbi:flavin reductase family protein [Streptomyces sp. NPDC058773]|uniref:flavin reductase family protein n=1 Tax=Streptomyces sp. NPDC058773 TaxID=3346632 RepID=UPI00368E7BB4
MSADTDSFRSFFGSVPTAVAVVTAAAPDGTPQGFTCNSFTAVSDDPPLLLVCASRVSRTLPSVLASGGFVLHLLADGGQELGRVFAGQSARKFDGLVWRPSPSCTGAPLLDDDRILASAECTVVHTQNAGDHTVLVGRMEATRVHPRRPVLYQQGTFTPWQRSVEAAVQA